MFQYLKADLKRLSSDGRTPLRSLLAGLLSQGFQAIAVYRLFNWLHRKGLPGQPLRFICERFIEITTGISIPARCRIGAGLRIHHFGGIVFHPTTILGESCTIYHGVTIGDRGGQGNAARIADNVTIGAGAKVIGEVNIGQNVIIGANAVVTKDVPDNTVVVGSPGRYMPRKEEASLPPKKVDGERPVRVMDLRGTYKGGGGPDKTVLNSAAQHDPERVHVVVTYLRQPDDHEFQIPELAAALGINYVDVYDRRLVDFQCVRQLRGLLKEHDLELIHAHDDKTLLYGFLLKILTPKVSIMYTCHSHAVHDRSDFPNWISYLKFKLRQNIQIALMKRYQRPIITVSEDTQKRLIDNGLRPEGVAVLHNGIDVAVWERKNNRQVLKEELGLSPYTPLVGTVARITYEKDLPTFFQIARRVNERLPEAVFVVVGDGFGNELDTARQQAKELGVEPYVHLIGHRTDLQDVYASLDLFLMTSITEGLPNTLLEAMAMGVPAISTDVGGVPEMMQDGVDGFLHTVGDVKGMSERVVKLLSCPEELSSFSLAARKRIESHFSFERRVRAMENYYADFRV